MSCLQLRWPAPNHADLVYVIASTSRESHFSARITLQIIGGRLLASVPYAFIGFDCDYGHADLEIIFPANRFTEIEIELKKLGLHYNPPQILDSFIRVERCLRYSIAWRLPPAWNQVERKLIMGDKFFDEGSNYHWFVDFNISLSPKIVLTVANCAMIRLKPLTLETLFPQIRNNRSERAELQLRLSDGKVVACEPSPCIVLPSLNESSIIAVAKKPFGIIDTVEKMSSYWTGRYGYRLESKLSARESFYCEVVFPEGSRFLYPHCCLKIDRGTVVHRHNSQHTVSVLQEDVDKILGGLLSTSNDQDIVKYSPSFDSANSMRRETK